MAISTTKILRYIKRNLGASHRPLPISDEDIIDIIQDDTLTTFSNYFPYLYNVEIKATNRVPNRAGVYFIDGDGLEILGVFDVKRTHGSPFLEGYADSYVSAVDGMSHQLITDISSYTQVPTTFEFLPPNMVEVFPKNYFNENMLVTLKCVHPAHLATVPLSMREEFYTLALLDVKIALWQILKNYSGLATAVGNIELKIEDYEAATSERKDLLERWRENYLKDSLRRKIWIG